MLLGFYDLWKKLALRGNPVLPVLFASIAVGAAVWLPFVVWSWLAPGTLPADWLQVAPLTPVQHVQLLAKSALVVLSWICGFHGIRRLPLSIAGPIRASSPVWTILLAVVLFGEAPAPRQWLGVAIILGSFLVFSLVGRREGIRFHRDLGVWFMIGATLLGSLSALYDKFLLQHAAIPPSAVQAWFSIYLLLVLAPAMLIRRWRGGAFRWHWAVPLVGLTLLAADLLYFTAVAQPDALISLVSPVRRGGAVVVSFALGIALFRERQPIAKALCIAGIIGGIVLLA
jgi:bacterial/archaeal transporter family protein